MPKLENYMDCWRNMLEKCASPKLREIEIEIDVEI